jgi:hypothetical protein
MVTAPDGVRDHVDGITQVQAADDDRPATRILAEERTAQSHQHREARPTPVLSASMARI